MKEKNITLQSIKGTKRKEIEASLWNELGLYYLNNRMYLDALMIYEHMLQTILKVQKDQSVDIHKGLPLYNMGVAQINLHNYDEGIPNILKAYEEDVATLGKAEAEKQLAHKVKEGLIDFTSRIIDNNFLKEFSARSGVSAKNTISLLQNMDEVEKLFFAKVINSKKLVTFHDNMYTRVVMLDNLKNLCLILESNLKRRSGRTDMLFGLIVNTFKKEEWRKHFMNNACFIRYKTLKDFQDKIDKMERTHFSKEPEVDFTTRNFLTTTLVRNFTAHYLNERLDVLEDSKKYDSIFAREVFSILYSLAYIIK